MIEGITSLPLAQRLRHVAALEPVVLEASTGHRHPANGNAAVLGSCVASVEIDWNPKGPSRGAENMLR